MDTVAFLDSVLASTGLRALAVFRNGLGAPPTHFFYDNNQDLVDAVDAYTKMGKNTFFGTATYKEEGSRKGSNAAAAKSLWTDLDVGPTKPYQSAQDAVAAAEKFRAALGMPETHIVKSGSGIHTYQPFSKPIAPEDWARLAAYYAACMDHFGVQHDTSRTQDIASILRVPGGLNFKTDPAKSIRVLRPGVEVPVRHIYERLKQYAEDNGLIIGVKPTKVNAQRTNELIAPKDYPPSEGSIIALHCPIIKHAAETGGDNDYEVWWRTIGIAKHTTTPDETAEHWTRNRESTGHDKTDWKTVLVNWNAGPTTCAEFSKHSDKCAACPHNGKIKSPIQLGSPADPVVNVIKPDELSGPPAPPPDDVDWTFGAEWIQKEVCKRTRTGIDSKGRMTMNLQQEDGTYKPTVFCDKYWQVMRRLKLPDGAYELEIGYQKYPGMPHETFTFPSAIVTSPDLLKKEFSSRELHIYGGQKAMNVAQHILRENQAMLMGFQRESVVMPTMGWCTANNTPYGELTGNFVFGTKMYKPKAPPAEVVLGENIAGPLRSGELCRGSKDEWIALVNRIYNRPGAEMYQFLFCAMLAAPLVKLTSENGVWHGIPISIWGQTGAAKTSTAMAAMTIYGPPKNFTFAAQKSGGDTINALSLKMGALNNLPFVADEMSGQDPEHIRDVMYMLANGKAKDRMGPNGKMIPNPYRWDTISIITSNESLHEKLRELRNSHVQDATSLRCFEFEVKPEDLTTLFSDVDRNMVEKDLCGGQYGHVGQDWIQFLVNNRLGVAAMLDKYRRTYKISEDDRSDIRFYKDLLLTVEVAAWLAQKRGYFFWDVPKMMTAAKDNLLKLRASVSEKDWESTAASFVASLHGRTIVTKNLNLGRGRRANVEMSHAPLALNTPPVARMATDDKLFFVHRAALTKWASDSKISAASFVNALEDMGLLVVQPDGKQFRSISIGSGTDITIPQAACYQLDFNRLTAAYGSPGLDAAADNNVVQFPGAVTEVVTAPSDTPPESAAST